MMSSSQGLYGGVSLLFGNNGSCSLILVILARETFGEVDVPWCGTIGNCKGGGFTWEGVTVCWCSYVK